MELSFYFLLIDFLCRALEFCLISNFKQLKTF